MADIVGQGLVAGVVKQTLYNEIDSVNFFFQAKETDILTLKNPKNPNNPEEIDYLTLFDYLVEKQIINCNYRAGSLVNFSSICTFDKKESLETLKKKLGQEKDYPEDLKFYKVNHKKLYNFLNNFVYKPSDEFQNAKEIGKALSNELFGKKKENKRFSKKVKPNKKKSLSKRRNKRR